MIRLNTPIESLVINLQSAGNVQYNIQYVIVRQGTRLEKSTEGLLTSSGQNVVLINDFSSGYFDITYINVTNIDPTENFISVLKKTNVSEFNLTSEAIGLKNRECTEFTSESGFKVLDQNGSFKTITESMSADGDVENSDMSYMASVPSGGTLTLPDSQINVNGIDEGNVVSVKLIDVNLTDGVDLVVPTSVGLVANTLTITLPASSDVDIEINGAPYDTITAPDTVDIPVINSAATPVGTINVLDVEIGDSSVTITDSAATLLHTVAVVAEGTNSQAIADTAVENSDASYSVNVLAEGSLTLPDTQINVNSVDSGDVVSVKTVDIELVDSALDPVTPTSVGIVGNTVTIEVPSGGPVYMTATGGTITTDGDFKIHTFTSSGDFEVLTLGDNPIIDFMLVAGGGSGAKSNGSNSAGGGGAGGMIFVLDETIASIGIKPIVIGGGGAARTTVTTGANGGNSTFLTYTATGGGGGGTGTTPGLTGGSGGGGAFNTPNGAGTSGQGFAGGAYIGADAGCGGGGAGQTGLSAFSRVGGTGGIGRQTYLDGTVTYYAGGGGGSPYATNAVGVGGVGGGGSGGRSGIPATAGTANTGGGGGGGYDVDSGAGGSGICIIRYKYQ